MFREKGYASTSMRDLAKSVGMEAASLYNHIKSKQEILAELLLDVAQSFMDGMEEIESSPKSPLSKIEDLIKLHIHIAVDKTDASSLLTQEWRHLEGDALTEFNNKRKDYEIRFREIISRGIENGEIKKVDPEIALFSILSTLRWFYAWYSRKEEMDIEILEQQFCELLIGGLKN